MPRTTASNRIAARNVPHSIGFDGAGDFIDFGNSYAFERTDSFSICGFFLARGMGTTNMSLIRKSSTAADNAQGWAVFINTADRIPTFFFSANSTTNRINQPLTSASAIQVGRWYFWGAKYDGSSQAAGVDMLFLQMGRPLENFNTKDAPTNDALSQTTVNTRVLRIGVSSDGTRAFNGLQQEVSIFNAALSIDEFKRIYYEGKYPSSRVSTWIGEGAAGSGATVEDEVGAIDGTITAATWSTESFNKARGTASARSSASGRTAA